jgi:hypothetical protein
LKGDVEGASGERCSTHAVDRAEFGHFFTNDGFTDVGFEVRLHFFGNWRLAHGRHLDGGNSAVVDRDFKLHVFWTAWGLVLELFLVLFAIHLPLWSTRVKNDAGLLDLLSRRTACDRSRTAGWRRHGHRARRRWCLHQLFRRGTRGSGAATRDTSGQENAAENRHGEQREKRGRFGHMQFLTEFSQLRKPQIQTVYFLLGLAIAGTWSYAVSFSDVVGIVVHFGALLLGYSVAYFPLVWWKTRKIPLLANSAITVLIAGLLLSLFASPLALVFTGAILALVKLWVRFRSLPIFNPATAAMFLGSFWGVYASWWGVSFAPRFTTWQLSVAILAIAPIGLYLAHKYRKLPAALSALVATGVVTLVVSLAQGGALMAAIHDVGFLLFEGTFAFFALIMVTEPKTSPTLAKEQMVFGAWVGVTLPLLIAIHNQWPYELSLLSANLGYLIWKWWRARSVAANPTASPPATQVPTPAV